MNERHPSPVALTAAGTARRDGRAGAPPRPQTAAGPSRWSGPRMTALVTGALLVLLSLVLVGTGGTGLWADLTQRDAGYVTTDEHAFSIAGSALATEPTHFGSPGVEWLYSPGVLGKVRIRVTPVSAGGPLFVGIARSADVDRYLAGVSHTVVSDFFGDKLEAVGGGSARSAPGAQHFWAASSTGPGTRDLLWKPSHGSWTVVVMNADARPGIDVRADLGARMPAVLWIAVGLLAGGAVLLAGGGLLVAGAIRGRDSGASTPAPEVGAPDHEHERRSHADH